MWDLIRHAEEGVDAGGLRMAQTRSDIRADVRRYLLVSAAAFALGLALGFLAMHGLGWSLPNTL